MSYDLLDGEPKLSGRQIEDRLGASTEHTQKSYATPSRSVSGPVESPPNVGPRRAVLHSKCVSALECVASASTKSSECVSASIEDALHSDTQDGVSALPDAKCCEGGPMASRCQLCTKSPTYWRAP